MIKFSIAENVRAKKTYVCRSRQAYEMSKGMQAKVRELAERIKAATDEKVQQALKRDLPIRIMNAWIAEIADENGKMVGKERKAENAIANGACVCDFDHLGCSAREVWPGIRERALALNPLLVEVSIREEGLHFIGMCPKGLTIQESCVWYGLKLGLVEYVDKAVHDLARALYCVPKENLLYIDEYSLWGDKEPYVPVPTDEEIAAVREILGKKVVTENPCEISTTAKPVMANPSKDYPMEYQGIPFADIRDELLRLSPDIELDEKGLPKEGFRHTAEVMIAQNMKTITDSNVEWLMQIIPNYEEDEAAWRQACESAKSYEVKYQSSNLLKQAIKNLREKQNSAQESASGNTDWQYADNPPRMPKRLPELVNLLIERVPKHTRESVINGSMSALATLTSGEAWFYTYPSRDHYELNMLTCTICGTSGGKSDSEKVNNIILKAIKMADKNALAVEEEWKQNAAKKAANKEGEKRKKVLILTCMQSLTLAVLMRRLMEAEEHGKKFLYCYYDELKDMRKLSNSKQDIKAICCHAFESKEYGKECDGKEYLSARAPLRFNHHVNAVISDARDWFKDGLTDGYFNRYSFAFIADDDRFKSDEELFHGDFDDEEYQKRLEPYFQNLLNYRGEIICPEAVQVAKEIRGEIGRYYELTYDKEFENLSRRGLIIAHRKALILYIAQGCKWSKEIADFMRWSFRYDLWVKLHFFGKALREARGKETVEKVQPYEHQLVWVKNVFTAEDMVKARKDHHAMNADLKKVKDAIRQWKKREFIRKNEDGTYTKLKYRSQE